MTSPKSKVGTAAAGKPRARAPLLVGVIAVGCVCYAANTLTARWAVEAAPEAVASAPAFVAPEWVTADTTANARGVTGIGAGRARLGGSGGSAASGAAVPSAVTHSGATNAGALATASGAASTAQRAVRVLAA